MYSLKSLSKDFQETATELKSILIELSNEPKSFKRDVFIGGSFLKFIVCWENFSEEYFLACMCGARTKTNKIIKPKYSSLPNKMEAFKKLNINRKSRETDYIDWLDSEKLKQFSEDYFRGNSRVHILYEDPNMLYQIKIIRNHIAHNSEKSLKKFKEFIIRQVGYLKLPKPNAADLLISIDRRKSKMFFIIYVEYYIELSQKLSK